MSGEIVPGRIHPCVVCHRTRSSLHRVVMKNLSLRTVDLTDDHCRSDGRSDIAGRGEGSSVHGRERNDQRAKSGYSLQIGTLVSMLAWVRPAVTQPGITQADPDVLFAANDQYLLKVVSCVRTLIASCRTG